MLHATRPRSRSLLLPLLVVLVLMAGCAEPERPPAALQTGAQTLVANDFDALAGQRVGLIVNHTARVDTAHLIDRIHRAPNVEIGALFGPEHGLRGTADAGEKVADGVDDRTGAPIYSLYGANRQPTAAQLEGLDALVFDIQDVGARFYTYISTMGLAMQAAAESDVPFIVLDRPNPLGGDYVSGFVREPEQESFVGQYPIPIAHGMTVGELARMIQGEAMLPGLESLDLRVVYDTSYDSDGAVENMAGSASGTQDGDPAGMFYDLQDVKPGDSGHVEFCFEIVDNPSYMWVCGDLTQAENGMTEPEMSVDTDDLGEVDDLPVVSCSRCDAEWTLEYELEELCAGNQAVEQFALDHARHTGHYPDDVTPW